jgi:hypothetical protein
MALPNSEKITSQIAMLPDAALKQMAMMHKSDPYVLPLIISEDGRRKQMRRAAQAQMGAMPQPKVADAALAQIGQLPEDQGIAQIPAPNMQRMADGGIAGYGDEEEQRMAMGGMGGEFDFAQRSEPVLRMSGGGMAGYADGGPIAFAKAGAVKDPLAQYEEQIRREAVRQGVDPDMAMRLFKAESAGNAKAVSPKGATGLGQLMVPAAAEMGLKPEERTDPAKNIPASIGYFKKQLNTFKDPEKALAAYNWGPGNVQKHLAENKGQLNKAGLPKETANYINKILPIGTAYAEPTAAAAAPVDSEEARRAALISQIPGGVPMAQAPAGPAPTGNEIVKGTAKTALALGQNTLAVPAAGISTLARRAFGDPTANFEETLGRYSYSPDDAVSQQQLQGIGKAMSDLKVPAYIPMIGGFRGAPKAGMADDAAAAAKVKNLRLGENTPANVANLATDQAAATAARARTATTNAGAQAVNETLPGVTNRSTGVGSLLTGVNAANANPDAVAIANADPFEAAAKFRTSERESRKVGDDMPKEDKKEIVKLAKETVPKAERKGLTNDDYLMMGLGLLASKSSDFGQAFGEAGLGTMKSRREREKDEREAESDLIKNKYYGALSRQADAAASSYESGEKMLPQALLAADRDYKAWAGSMEGQLADATTRETKRQELVQNQLRQFRIAAGAGSSPQLSTADQALVAKYAG